MLTKDLLFTGVFALACGLGLACLILERHLHRLRQLTYRQPATPAPVAAPAPPASEAVPAVSTTSSPAAPFNAELDRSRLQIRLQGGQGQGAVPEKYRLVGNMLQRGLSPGDISAVLGLSPLETEQLVKLAQVARPASPQP